MTTYASLETSTQSGRPIMLFLFAQGANTYRYVTQGENVTFLSQTWYAAPLVCGSFSTTGDYPKDTIAIKLPVSDPLAETFLGFSPESITSVTVYRAHLDGSDYRVYWKGRVASHSVSGAYVSLECEPVFSSLRRVGLRQVYTRQCRHVLYGPGCALLVGLFTISGTVSAISSDGVTVTIAEAATKEIGYFSGGMLEMADGSARTIIANAGTSVTLLKPFQPLVAALLANPSGVSVSIVPGCDHSIETCEEKFNNKGNFGGAPWMPIVNPYKTSMG